MARSRFLPFAALLAAVASPALADMGRAPAGPGGHYLSIEGGFLHQEGSAVIGYGIADAIGGPVTDITVSPAEGWFAGAMLGWNTGRQILPHMPFTRIEGYALFGSVDDSASDTATAGGETLLKSADGDLLGIGGTAGSTDVERRFVEGGLRFEGDNVRHEGGSLKDEAPVERHSITWVLNPFVRWTGEESESHVPNCCATRSADVDTWAYGALLAMEPELLLRPGVALVGRGGIGLYGYDADGDFHSASAGSPDPFAADFSDSESGVGFRGQLGAGLKFWMSERSILDVFAEADYFSDIGTAAMSDNQPANADSSRVETEDLWEVRLGARLTLGLDGN
jgi:hypothetical protein